MTEANFSFTTKINGDLLTIRGMTYDEFTTHVATAVLNLQQLVTDLSMLQGAANAAPLVAPPQPVAPQAPAQPQYQQQAPAQPAAAPQFAQPAQPQQPSMPGTEHICQCGLPMRLRNSQYGSFYSCSKSMSDPTRCQAKVNV